MSETQLERRYRRLLAFYPNAFRREHEQEMLSVLLAGAAEGQRRPTEHRAPKPPDLTAAAMTMRAPTNSVGALLFHGMSLGPAVVRPPRRAAFFPLD